MGKSEIVKAEGSVEVVGGAFVDESAAAAQLTAQYRRAEGARGAFVREAVAFGAMMIRAEAALVEASLYLVAAATKYKTCKNNAKSTKNGRWGEGRPNSGIEDWLADHCPKINYSTAKGYKAMAAKMVELMGGRTGEVLAALCAPHELNVSYGDDGEVGASVIEARERLFGEATSRRKLERLWLASAGRPAGGKAAGAAPDANDPAACARAEWSRVIVPATNTVVLEAAARLLCRRDVEDALAALGVLVDYLHGREAELKKERRS